MFFKIYRKIPEQESHFNKLSYLKRVIVLKRDSNTDTLQCHYRNISGQLLLITSQGDHFWLQISTNKHVFTNKNS